MRNHRRSKAGVLAGLLAVAVLSLAPTAAWAGSAEDRELLKAAEQGRLEQVRDLLRRGARLETKNVSGATPLMLAAGRGHLAVVLELLRAGADPNVQSTAGWSILDYAVDKDDLKVAEALVAKGASAAWLKDGGARMLATASSRPPMVLLLLAAGARTPLFQDRAILESAAKAEDTQMLNALLRPFERKSWPGKPLHIALLARDRAKLLELLRAGISPDGITREGGTPLTTAVGMSSSESVRILLDAGAAVDGEADRHLVPLVLAVKYDNLKIVDLLLSRGADVNHLPPRPGTTALVQAASQGNLEIVRRLLQRGANPNLRDADGFSPLQQAAREGREEVVAELLAHGAIRAGGIFAGAETPPVLLAVDACDGDSLVALLAAGEHPGQISLERLGHCPPETILTLSQAGFDLNRRGADGLTILAVAVRERRPKTALRLLELGVDPNVAGPDGETPLMRAAADARDGETVKLLLEHRADPGARDARGRTALHRAADVAARWSISLLAQAGADPEVRDRDGRTPGDLYWRKLAGSSTAAVRTAGPGLRHVYFALPAEFSPCSLPRERDPFELARCRGVSDEREVGVSVAWASRGSALRSSAPGEKLTVFEKGQPVPIARYQPANSTLSNPMFGVIESPEVWMALVPGRSRPILLRVWAPREYGLEARWILGGMLRTFREPAPMEQFLALGAGRIASVLGVLLALLATVAVLGVWGFRMLRKL